MLSDASSTHVEGDDGILAEIGCFHEGKRGKKSFNFSLMCDVAGTAVAVKVFSSRMVDRKTLTAQLDTLRHKFGLAREIQMGDRGLLTSVRLREEVRPAGYDRISELRKTASWKLAGQEAIQLSLVD